MCRGVLGKCCMVVLGECYGCGLESEYVLWGVVYFVECANGCGLWRVRGGCVWLVGVYGVVECIS